MRNAIEDLKNKRTYAIYMGMTDTLTLPHNAPHLQASLAPSSPTGKASSYNAKAWLEQIEALLREYKTEEIVTISLAGKSDIASFMVIATVSSNRQARAVAEHIHRACKELGIPSHIEGLEAGEWVLIDAEEVIVHLFQPSARSLYQLEKMWAPFLPKETAPSSH